MGQIFIRRQRASCTVLAHKIWSAYLYPSKSYGGSRILNLGHVTLTTLTIALFNIRVIFTVSVFPIVMLCPR